MKTVSVAQAATAQEAVLPARVQEALGELVGAAKEGLLALSVGVGRPRGWQRDARRPARAGSAAAGTQHRGSEEVPLATYAHFADRDALTGVVLERMLAGVSTRRYARTQEPVGEEVEQASRSTSKSAVSRAFVERTSERLGELMARRLDDIRLAVLMLDGIDMKGRCNVVALGITTEGVKIPLGLWEGSTENAAVATALLADLVDRGLHVGQGVLFVLDGAKALRKAVRDVLGAGTPVQRCIRHYVYLRVMPTWRRRACCGGRSVRLRSA